MSIDTLAAWHAAAAARNAGALDTLLADDIVFHSPVVFTPQRGKRIVTQYLAAAFHVFADPSFQYVREVHGSREAVLEFQVDLDGITVNGVDMLSWNSVGRITDFKVMIRPLKAVNLIHERMAAMLAARR